MDVLIVFLFVICLFCSLITLSDWMEKSRLRWYVVALNIVLFSAVVWAGFASSTHNLDESNRQVTLHKILKDADTVFYWDRNHQPRVLDGDKAHADRATTAVKITTVSGGWTYGIYVTGSGSTELVAIDAASEQTEE